MFCIGDAANSDLIFFIFSSNVPPLIYYSHIPAIVVSLLLGFFVFFKSKDFLASKIFLALSLTASLLAMLDLIIWTQSGADIVMFLWSLWCMVFELIFVFSLYFIYVFIDKKDISLKIKMVLLILLLPIFFITPTKYNLSGINLDTCNANEGLGFINYVYLLATFLSLWIAGLAFLRFRKADKIFKKQIVVATLGIILFLSCLSISTYYGSIETFLNDAIHSFDIEQYGFFGMPFFIAFLGYLIVKYKAFNVKLIGAQALVIALIVLIGSQFFYVTDITISRVLTGITITIAIGFGYMLIKSIKMEVERKEQLQLMADSLAIANDKLRILDKAKTEFISIASHQLRTPVTAIKGFSSLLLEGSYGEVSAAVKGALEKVFVSSERLVNLIEDLLNVSRIESGRLTFTFEMGSVNDILKELYDNFMLIAKSKKFYLDLKVPETPLPKIKMDAAKVRELISNFIDNAFKYTEKGGVTVKAEIRESGVVIDEDGFVKEGEKSPYGKVVRVTVSDTGIGVPKEEIPSLFKKFSRGKDVSRLHVGGTGLGLFVGKAIADAHHGATWVESDGEGKGSRFIIEIPVADATSDK